MHLKVDNWDFSAVAGHARSWDSGAPKVKKRRVSRMLKRCLESGALEVLSVSFSVQVESLPDWGHPEHSETSKGRRTLKHPTLATLSLGSQLLGLRDSHRSLSFILFKMICPAP